MFTFKTNTEATLAPLQKPKTKLVIYLLKNDHSQHSPCVTILVSKASWVILRQNTWLHIKHIRIFFILTKHEIFLIFPEMCESLGPYLPTTYPNHYKKTNSANVMINDNEQLVVKRRAR